MGDTNQNNSVQDANFAVTAQSVVRVQLSHLVDKLIVVFGDTSQDDGEGTKENIARVQLNKTFKELVIVFDGSLGNNTGNTRAFVKDLLAKAISDIAD